MIEIFKKTEGKLKRIREFEKYSWVNISSPTNEEAKKLAQELNIPRVLDRSIGS